MSESASKERRSSNPDYDKRQCDGRRLCRGERGVSSDLESDGAVRRGRQAVARSMLGDRKELDAIRLLKPE